MHVASYLQERCRQSFYRWCREIYSVCRTIGEASMIRAFNRRQEGGSKGSMSFPFNRYN